MVTSLVLLLLYPYQVPLPLLDHVNWLCVAKPVKEKEKSLLDKTGHMVGKKNVCFICWTTGTSVFTNTSHIYFACINWLYNSLARIEFHSFKKRNKKKKTNNNNKKKRKKKANTFTKEKIYSNYRTNEMKSPYIYIEGVQHCADYNKCSKLLKNDRAVNYCEIINPDMCGILLGVFLQTFTHTYTCIYTDTHTHCYI